MKKVLLDANLLIGLYDPEDVHHAKATAFVLNNSDQLIIPDAVLAEVAFVLRARRGAPAVWDCLEAIATGKDELEPVTRGDMTRAAQIMRQYRSLDLDFADAAIMAAAERLETASIGTFNYRDFGVVRPKHAPYFELLP